LDTHLRGHRAFAQPRGFPEGPESFRDLDSPGWYRRPVVVLVAELVLDVRQTGRIQASWSSVVPFPKLCRAVSPSLPAAPLIRPLTDTKEGRNGDSALRSAQRASWHA